MFYEAEGGVLSPTIRVELSLTAVLLSPSSYLPFAECILTDCKYTGFFIKKKKKKSRVASDCSVTTEKK
jgi:hypothetical protein